MAFTALAINTVPTVLHKFWVKISPALKLIICHLGNGCSLAAIHEGRSIDTTMGFTPLDGLMMGSRSGAVDPGILLYLLRQEGYTADQLDQMLNKDSGLKGHFWCVSRSTPNSNRDRRRER